MNRRDFLAAATAAALTPGAHAAATSGDCGIPSARDDGWAIAADPATLHVNRADLCAMADRLTAHDVNIHAVLVAQGGRLVFERYFTGADEVPGLIFGRRVETVAFNADTLHDIKSVSKSVASLTFGIAVDQGLIGPLDQPIFKFFPELADLRTPEKDKILLSHVLNMTMGLDWIEATPATGDFNNDEARMNMARDPCRFVLSRPVISPAGSAFFYNTGALRLISTLLHHATGQLLGDFARQNLFGPLGIVTSDWEVVRGETDAGGGLRMRPRDMAKIGQLVLNGGSWHGRQIVSRAWIETSTAPRVKAVDGMQYGYLWWAGRIRANGREAAWIGALGRGGQSIRIIPDLDLVVAVTAGYYQDYSRDAFQTQFSVFRDVVRSVAEPG